MSLGWTHEAPGRTVEWYTPPWIFEALGLKFELDPAAPPGGVPWVPARRSFSELEDGLAQPWRGRVWLNPPYGRDIGRWLDRLATHGDGMALVFARSDTRWFQSVVPRATACCLIAGRIRFVTADGRTGPASAGSPSALLAFGLSCALALSTARLGQTFLVPGPGSDREREPRAVRQSPARSLDSFKNLNDSRDMVQKLER